MAERAVRATAVVVVAPRVDLPPGIVDCPELLDVHTFIPKPAVEALDVAVFRGFARRIKSRFTPRRYAHSWSAIDVNSVP
jgi:hypothetical protein